MVPPCDESAATDGGSDDGRVSFSVAIENGETVITMHGDRDTAVVVRSESGERIYLPPEDFDRAAPGDRDGPDQSTATNSPYDGAGTDSPYQSASTDSPYQSASTDSPYQPTSADSPSQATGGEIQSEGLSATADGYRIRHPEPATDVRFLR